jgi:hypothetical protein
LIVDKRLGVTEAMTLSFNTLKPHMWSVLGFLIVAGLIGALGAIACGVGLFFTAPITYLAMALLYRNFFPDEGSSGPRLEMPLPPGYARLGLMPERRRGEGRIVAPLLIMQAISGCLSA